MKALRLVLLLAIVSTTAGCYHAKISTGKAPSAVVIDKPFANGWILGLVPPDPVEVMEECPNGVSMVETKLSFVNQLVANLTFGIYTPMHITVTCAAE
ncbi:MAG: hypothetical protein AAF752_11000 [Bacteroidota bacterium]